MDYYSFCELQPGDLVAANRGRFKGRMFEVESVDYDEETARVVWSTANEAVAPDPSSNGLQALQYRFSWIKEYDV